MQRIFLLLAISVVAACGEDKGAEYAKCSMEAEHNAPKASLFGGDLMGNWIKTCMRAKGYDFSDDKKTCPDVLGVYIDKCYRQRHFWNNFLDS